MRIGVLWLQRCVVGFSFILLVTACGFNPIESTPQAVAVQATEVLVEATAVAALPTDTPLSAPTVAAPSLPTAQPTRTAVPTSTATATPVPTATDTPIPSDTPTPTETPTPSATHTPTSEPPPWDILPWLWNPAENAPATPPAPLPPPPELVRSPGSPTPYLTQFRLIGFYGSPAGRGLGVLGNQFRNETVRMIRGVIAEYRPYSTDGRYLMPLFHMITTVAKACVPEHLPNCTTHIDTALIYDWLVTADNNNAAVTLDIQPGRAPLMDEFNRIREFLYFPHVHLAIDPEFRVNDQQVPNQQIGMMDAEDINMIQAEMNQIALELGINRVLILHQFKDSMITNKQNIVNYPHVELVINGDGYGPPGPKIRNYLQYANEPGFEYGGFKMFTDQVNGRLIYDVPFMLPQRVMTVLEPQPVIIMFQ
jgi:hypothetical protein